MADIQNVLIVSSRDAGLIVWINMLDRFDPKKNTYAVGKLEGTHIYMTIITTKNRLDIFTTTSGCEIRCWYISGRPIYFWETTSTNRNYENIIIIYESCLQYAIEKGSHFFVGQYDFLMKYELSTPKEGTPTPAFSVIENHSESSRVMWAVVASQRAILTSPVNFVASPLPFFSDPFTILIVGTIHSE